MSDTPRPLRQEAQPASLDVVEVAPNVLRMQLPIELPGLAHVNCYALIDSQGAAIVDPGLPGEDSYNALLDRLAKANIPLKRVHTVIVTHSHPDHFGGAGRVRVETGANVVAHTTFRTWFDAAEEEGIDLADDKHLAEDAHWERDMPWGGKAIHGPPDALSRRRMALFMTGVWGTPQPTTRIADADVIKLAGREWIAVHTPGHTPDHLCLYDPAEGTFLSGDHVLPTITPHIGGIGAGADPLAEFFTSLERMKTFAEQGVKQVLPAHGQPFADLAGRATAIEEHHQERLEKLRQTAAELGKGSVEEFSHHLFAPRSWGTMAMSETFAHLEHLRLLGDAESHVEDDMLIYEVSSAPAR